MNIKNKIYNNISYNTNEKIKKINQILAQVGVISVAAFPLYNTTLEYLIVSIINTLNIAYSLLSLNSEEYTKEVQQIKKLYQELLEEYIKLNKKLELKNPVELYTLYNKMLYDGYLSKDKNFHFGDEEVRDIQGIYPANIINGEAVCRHISEMLKDIYTTYGIEGNTLSVFQISNYEVEEKEEEILNIINKICEENKKLEIPIVDLIYKYEEELNKYYKYDTKNSKKANHRITTAVYKGNTYYLDPTQSRIYKPSNISKDCLIDELAVRDIKIIPSINKKNIKTLTSSFTPFSKDQSYIEETIKKYEHNKDITERFYQENKELYSDISSELSKIKVKRKK